MHTLVYSGACTVVPVQWCLYSGVCTVVPVQWCLYSGACTVVPVQWCLYSGTCTVVPVQWCLYSGACTVVPVQTVPSFGPHLAGVVTPRSSSEIQICHVYTHLNLGSDNGGFAG